MKIVIWILGILLTSAVYGLFIAVFIILYFNVGEKIQVWSERYNPPKKWIRRGFHLFSCVFAIFIFFYTFLFWISFEIDLIKKVISSSGPQLILFIFIFLSFITPFILLRKKLFREFNVKKLWE